MYTYTSYCKQGEDIDIEGEISDNTNKKKVNQNDLKGIEKKKKDIVIVKSSLQKGGETVKSRPNI